MRTKTKKSLEDKIKEAKERTRQWALGVKDIKFPEVPDLEVFGSIHGFRGTSPANKRRHRGVEFYTKPKTSDKIANRPKNNAPHWP